MPCAFGLLLFFFKRASLKSFCFIFKQAKEKKKMSSHGISAIMNPAGIHEEVFSIPGLAQWVKDPALL